MDGKNNRRENDNDSSLIKIKALLRLLYILVNTRQRTVLVDSINKMLQVVDWDCRIEKVSLP